MKIFLYFNDYDIMCKNIFLFFLTLKFFITKVLIAQVSHIIL